MKTFKSVADLKLAKLRTGQFVETNGYYAEADGGGAKYYIVASQAADEYGDHTLANGNVAVLQDAKTNLNYGCAADSVVNDTLALQALDAAGGGVIKKGIVRVKANITLVSNYEFKNGGIIAPDSIYTVAWSGAITAGDYKIFDGNFKVSKVNKVSEVKVVWFGALSSDLDSDMGDQTLADSNAKAIRQAASMVNIGIPAGIYVTPILRLLNGLCIVDDDDNDGVILDIGSYMTVLGYGDASVIRPKNNAKAFDVMSMTVNGASSMVLNDFQIYGEASAQVNAQNGIVANPPAGSQIYNKLGNGIYVKEMSGNAAKIIGQGWENSKWSPRLMRDSTLHNLLVTRCNEVEFTGCTYRTAKFGNSGAVFDGPGVIAAHIHHNNFDENNVNGLVMSNTGGRHRVHDNGMKSNFTGQGASFDRVDHSQIHGNKFEANGTRGATIDNCTNVDWANNKSRSNQEHGQVFACNNSNILGNSSYRDGQGADNTYSGILITGAAADDNNAQGNKVRHGGGAVQLKYGFEIAPAGAGANFVTNNDLKNSGRTTDFFNDGGGTVTTPGNRT